MELANTSDSGSEDWGFESLKPNKTVNGVTVAHLGWSRRFQVIVHMGRLDGVRNNGGSSNLPWLTNNNIYV